MDLSTSYLGLDLPNPLMIGASPLANDLDGLRRLADAGAAAVVVHSLFEEQIARDATDAEGIAVAPTAEAPGFFPGPGVFAHAPDDYLEKIRKAKAAVDIPVIGSLNGTAKGPWLDYARRVAGAGADAIELAIYAVPTDAGTTCASVEDRALDMVAAVKESVRLPVAVKISPFYSSLPHFVGRLDALGVEGVVVFNRFFHPDVDPEALEVERRLALSKRSDLFLRLRWLAVLSACARKYDLAISGGVHRGLDAIKAVMCGADAVQLVSTLLLNGSARMAEMLVEMERWMEGHGYASLGQMKGSMDLKRCPDAGAYERANYVHILQSWDAHGMNPALVGSG